MKLEIKHREKNKKKNNYMETKQHATKTLMGQQWNQRGNQKIPRDKWQWKHNHIKSMGCIKSRSKREVHSDTGLPQEIRKMLNKKPNLPSKRTRKRRIKTQSQ